MPSSDIRTALCPPTLLRQELNSPISQVMKTRGEQRVSHD